MSHSESGPPASDDQLEPAVAAVEAGLAALGDALRARDSAAIESNAAALHQALAVAVARFSKAAHRGRISPALRNRLVMASGAVAAQRESLARATAALDRAIDVLLPPAAAASAVYSASGSRPRVPGLGTVSA